MAFLSVELGIVCLTRPALLWEMRFLRTWLRRYGGRHVASSMPGRIGALLLCPLGRQRPRRGEKFRGGRRTPTSVPADRYGYPAESAIQKPRPPPPARGENTVIASQKWYSVQSPGVENRNGKSGLMHKVLRIHRGDSWPAIVISDSNERALLDYSAER